MTKSKGRGTTKALGQLLMSLALSSALHLGGFQKASLSEAQIDKLVAIGTPDEIIAQEIRERGLDFAPHQNTMADLAHRGAGSRTLSALTELMQPRAQSPADILYIPSHQGSGLIRLDIGKNGARQAAKTLLYNNSLVVWNQRQKELYVAATNGDAVSVIAEEPFREVAALKGDIGWNTASMVLSGDGTRLYLGCAQGGSQQASRIVSFDTVTRRHIGTTALSSAAQAPFLALSHDGSKLFVSSGDNLDEFDPKTLKLLRQRRYRGWDGTPLAESTDGRFLFVTQRGRLVRWSTNTRTIDGEVVLPEASGPRTEIAMSRDGKTVFVAGQKAIYGVSISMQGYSTLRPPIAARSVPFEFSESTDGRILYVLSGTDQDERLWAIDIITQQVAQTFNTIPYPARLLAVGDAK